MLVGGNWQTIKHMVGTILVKIVDITKSFQILIRIDKSIPLKIRLGISFMPPKMRRLLNFY